MANELTVHIMAAMAQYEAKAISERTRVALGAAKARGTKLGIHAHLDPAKQRQILSRVQPQGHVAGLKVRRANKQRRNRDLLPSVEEKQRAGLTTLRTIAEAFNGDGIPSPHGGQWHANTVRRVLMTA